MHADFGECMIPGPCCVHLHLQCVTNNSLFALAEPYPRPGMVIGEKMSRQGSNNTHRMRAFQAWSNQQGPGVCEGWT